MYDIIIIVSFSTNQAISRNVFTKIYPCSATYMDTLPNLNSPHLSITRPSISYHNHYLSIYLYYKHALTIGYSYNITITGRFYADQFECILCMGMYTGTAENYILFVAVRTEILYYYYYYGRYTFTRQRIHENDQRQGRYVHINTI